MAEKRGPGRPEKPVPQELLEGIHEQIEHGRSERGAVRDVVEEYKDFLGERAFSRVKDRYREFKKQIGDQPLDEYRFEYARRIRAETRAATQSEIQAKLVQYEEEAAEALETNDLSDENLKRIEGEAQEEEMRRWKAVCEGPPLQQANMFELLFGEMPDDLAHQKRREVKEAVGRAERRGDFARELRTLREVAAGRKG